MSGSPTGKEKELQRKAKAEGLLAQLAAQEAIEREENLEYQRAAQIAALSCSIPGDAISIGIKSVIMLLRKKPKTKTDYNNERKRDVRFGKAVPSKIESVADALERTGKANYGLLSDPSPYVRDYSYKSFDAFKLHVHKKFETFQKIEQIDFAGQLLGDTRFGELCELITRSSVKSLSVSGNNITDAGLAKLAPYLRSLSKLEMLILSDNCFTDDGVKLLFEDDVYSPTLKMIDLSRNTLGYKTAHILGEMFHPSKHSALDSLFLGGSVGTGSWGDDFMRILLHSLSKPGYRPLRRLSIPDAGLSPGGVDTLCTLLVCSDHLEWLNISKTGIYSGSKQFLRLALSVNNSVKEIFLGRCGLTKHERNFFENLSRTQYPLTWQEEVFTSICLARELTECARQYHELVTLQTSTDWTIVPPMPFPHVDREIEKATFDPLLSPEALFWCPQEIKDMVLSCDIYFKYLIYLKNVVSDCLDLLPEHLVDSKNITIAHDKMAERKKIMLFNFSVSKTLCTRLAANSEPVTTKGKKAASKESQWAKKSKAKVSLDIESVAMCVEDLRSSVVEYATTIEAYVSEIYKTYIVHVKHAEKHSEEDGNDILREEIPYFARIGLAACFVHYVFTFDPAEKDRQRREAIAQERIMMIKSLEDLRNDNRMSKVRPILGRRFQLLTGLEAKPVEKGRPMVTRQSIYANLNDIKQEVRQRVQSTYVHHTIQEEDELQDEAEILAQMDKKYEVLVENRKPTRFLVAKKDLQQRYNDMIIEELEDHTAEFNLSRGSWRHYIGFTRQFASEINTTIYKNPEPVTISVEEELDRAESHMSLQTINACRAEAQLDQRLRHFREMHVRLREKELHE